MAGMMDAVSISNFMTREVKTADELSSIKQVTKLMYEKNIGCVVIVSHLKPYTPTGIVTERDILKVISLDQLYQPTSHAISLLDMTVQSFMSKPVFTISATATLWDAIQIMQQRGIRRLPVTDESRNGGKLIGIITERDVMEAIAKNRTIFCELAERLPGNSLMIERVREYGLSESFFWPDDSSRPMGL